MQNNIVGADQKGNFENQISSQAQKLRLLVLADDLTGANDSSVTFARAGYITNLLLNSRSFDEINFDSSEVIAISSDARPCADSARKKTFDVIKNLGNYKGTRLYLKIDSTMRGSVSHQIEGAIDARAQLEGKDKKPVKAIVCPAYPAMGRTIEGGILFVDGIPVSQTPSGKDPVCPVTSDNICELIPGAVSISGRTAEEIQEKISIADAEVIVVDANSNEDLKNIAEAVIAYGDKSIPVGSAGLANAIADLLPSPKAAKPINPRLSGRALVVVSSVHTTSQHQVDQFIRHEAGADAIVFSPHPAQLLNTLALGYLRKQLRSLIKSGNGTVIIRANPAVVKERIARSRLARRLAIALSDLARSALEEEQFGYLLLVGGDGAIKTLERCGAEAITVLDSLAEGVPVGTIAGGQWNNLPVITKSGGFGKPGLIMEICNGK